MKPPFVPLQEMIEGSEQLHVDLGRCLGETSVVSGGRADIAAALATLVIEHGLAMLTLVRDDMPSAGLALIRIQYEALLRSFWITFSASDAAVAKCIAPVPAESTKEPTLFPSVSVMLAKLDGTAPPAVVAALTALKPGAWDAMNSFAHGNLRAMVGHRNGYSEGLLSTAIQTANGAAVCAAMLFAQVAERPHLQMSLVDVSRQQSRFLPPHAAPDGAQPG